MKRPRVKNIVYAVLALLFSVVAAAQDTPVPAKTPWHLSLDTTPMQGDFDSMLKRRTIRVLVPYSRSLYYIDKGQERGISAELLRDFERYLNKRYARELKKRPLTVLMIVTTRDKLLSGVSEGLGDIAVGNLTVTDARMQQVDFVVRSDAKPMRELIVTGTASPAIKTLEDLSGQTVHVRKSSSYYESVQALNQRFTGAGKAPVTVAELPDALEDEDVMEMLNAGLLQFAVVDDWKAKMWAQVLPKIIVREDLVLRAEGAAGWAIRKDSPQLAGVATDFYEDVVKKHGNIEYRQAQQYRRIKQIANNTASDEMKRFEATIKLFEKYGAEHGFDPLMLAAQGFQESALRQDAKSQVGAIGIMQIMPATGKELKVGSIQEIEPNIHAGAKYMDMLLTQYFPDAKFSEEDRPLFAFASYNAGPGNIAKMRKDAGKRGLDPDKWFNNVEIVVAERIGMETTTYVRNIYKYYAAYKLVESARQAADKARGQVVPATQ